jgi:hypothetical protein
MLVVIAGDYSKSARMTKLLTSVQDRAGWHGHLG